MPRMIAREGLTIENVWAPVRLTALNPLLTGPLLAALIYDPKRVQSLLPEALHKIVSSARGLTWLKALVAVGVLGKINSYFSELMLNNFRSDKWRMGEEIVIVSGGASGIGAVLVQELAKSSKVVLCLDVSAPKKALPSNAFFYETDVTDSAKIAEVATKIRAEHGEPTILVNNAGVGQGQSILDKTEATIRRTFNVNTISHFLMVKEFLPAMIKNNHGHVVTVASMASFVTASNMVDYACTKASALAFHEGLTNELRLVYGAKKVRTTVVHPWWVRTPLIEKMISHKKWKEPVLEAETVADAIVEQLLSGKSGQLILPGRLTIAAGIRGFPTWLQEAFRNDTTKHLAGVGGFSSG